MFIKIDASRPPSTRKIAGGNGGYIFRLEGRWVSGNLGSGNCGNPEILPPQGFPRIGLSLAETAETPTTSRTRLSCRSSQTSETSMGGQDPVVHRRQIRRHEILALRQACDLARLDVNIEKTGAMLVLGHLP
jgi:hypothetical protein